MLGIGSGKSMASGRGAGVVDISGGEGVVGIGGEMVTLWIQFEGRVTGFADEPHRM